MLHASAQTCQQNQKVFESEFAYQWQVVDSSRISIAQQIFAVLRQFRHSY